MPDNIISSEILKSTSRCYFCNEDRIGEERFAHFNEDGSASRFICDSCLDQGRVVKCNNCCSYTIAADIRMVVTALFSSRTRKSFCARCLSSREDIQQCHECHNYFLERHVHSFRRSGGVRVYFCRDCASICDSCDEPYDPHYGCDCSNDDDNEDDDDDTPQKNDNGLYEYNYKPVPIFTPSYDVKHLYLGVELEVEASRKSKLSIASMVDAISDYSDLLYLKHDGSLDEGFEIVSHPGTLRTHKQVYRWGDILSKLQKWECSSAMNSTCGLHVHCNKSFLGGTNSSSVYGYKINRFVHSHRRELKLLGRRDSDYASFGRAELDNLFSGERRQAANLAPSQTIEFRFPRGTLHIGHFFSTLELIDCIMRYMNTINVQEASVKNWEAFKRFIGKQKEYTFLLKYVKEIENYVCNNSQTSRTIVAVEGDFREVLEI